MQAVQVYGVINGARVMTCGVIKPYPKAPGKLLHTATTQPSFSGTLIRSGKTAVGLHVGSANAYLGDHNVGLDLEVIRRALDASYRPLKEGDYDPVDAITKFIPLDEFEELERDERDRFSDFSDRYDDVYADIHVDDRQLKAWCSKRGLYFEEFEGTDDDLDMSQYPDDFSDSDGELVDRMLGYDDEGGARYGRRRRREFVERRAKEFALPPEIKEGGQSKALDKRPESCCCQLPVEVVRMMKEIALRTPSVPGVPDPALPLSSQPSCTEGLRPPVVIQAPLNKAPVAKKKPKKKKKKLPVGTQAAEGIPTNTVEPKSQVSSEPLRKEAVKEEPSGVNPPNPRSTQEGTSQHLSPLVITSGEKVQKKETLSSGVSAGPQLTESLEARQRRNVQDLLTRSQASLSSGSGLGPGAALLLRGILSSSKSTVIRQA